MKVSSIKEFDATTKGLPLVEEQDEVVNESRIKL
jgi:hypothetical protein